MLNQQLKNHIGGAFNGVRQAFRAVLNANNSNTDTQLSQIEGLAGENMDNVELMQQFGFTSNPPADTDVVVIPMGGKTSHSVIIATENGAYRIKGLPSGAVAVYAQDGTRIVLNNDKTIDHYADKTTFHGDVHIKGKTTTEADIQTTGDVVASNISLIKHTHASPETGANTSSSQ